MFESKRFDFYLFLPILLLLIFSFGLIVSVSPSLLLNHLVYVVLSLIFFFIFSFLDCEILISLSPIIYFFSLVFLILPFIFGTVTRGSVRWIPIGDWTIQPSEIIKPLLCLFSAWFWSRQKFKGRNLLTYVVFFSPFLFLVFIQPDLGSTLVIFCIFLGGVLLSEIKIKQLFFFSATFLLLIAFLSLFLKDYQKTRFLHFLNPSTDPLGQGYNQIQSIITVGSGGLIGRGLGKGTQSHLAFLPEKHTDFIFSSMAEEFGFIGCFLLLSFYLFLYVRVLKIAFLTKERKYFLLLMGIFIFLYFQTVINIGMNIGLLPITGVTLPLFSYGGSSLLATMIGLGIIENISRRNRTSEIMTIRHF